MQYTSVITDYLNYLPDYVKKILKEYEKQLPHNRFFIYKDYLQNHSSTKTVIFNKNRWEQRPYLFCFDFYSPSDQYVYPVILTLNNIKSFHEFIADNVKDQLLYAPTLDNLKEILTRT